MEHRGVVAQRLRPRQMLSGVSAEPDATYNKATANSYQAGGSSGFSGFTEGTGRTSGMIDLEASVAYSASTNEVAPGVQDRIMRLDWWGIDRRNRDPNFLLLQLTSRESKSHL